MEEEEQAGGVPASQYNHKMMAFLNRQLCRVKGLQKPQSTQPEEWQLFGLCVQKGHRLLEKHADTFNIRTFYKIDDAQSSIDEICEYLKAKAQEWEVDCRTKLEDCLPHDYVNDDREYLHKMLAYILKGAENGLDSELLCLWRPIKCRHEAEMKSLQIEDIEENVLQLKEQLGKGGYGVVQKAEWRGTNVAVKKPLRERDISIEECASFVREVMMHAQFRHPNIAEVYATTPSSWLVMELADTDLGAKCHSKKRLDWCGAINLLQQAAKVLCHLHSLDPPVIHSDVKASNFLIFGKEPSNCTVKITDFGLAVEDRSSRSKTVRLGQGTLEWMATELFDGKPTSTMSDVYSLGVIMYEVMTGEHPYGADKLFRRLKDAVVLRKKLQLEDPCRLRPEHCPEDMQFLMQRCCSNDPDERPTMSEISMFLQQLPADWSPPSQPPDEGVLHAGQMSSRRDGPTLWIVNAIVERLKISDLQRNPDLLNLWERGVLKLITGFVKWLTGIDIVAVVLPAQAHCVIFPVQIEFPDVHSAELSKQLTNEGASWLFQADLSLLAHQPRLELGFQNEHYVADGQVSELGSKVINVINEISKVVDIKYSCRMMHFLQTEIGRLAGCSLRLPDDAAAPSWKEDAAVVLHQLKFALSLLNQHTFVDINNLQKTADTRMAIERVLWHITSFESKWGFHETVQVHTAVGAELVQHDREILEKCLGYVFEGGTCSFEEFAPTRRKEWERLKRNCSEKRQKLEVIDKEDVKWQSAIAEDVHLAVWGDTKVAAKQVIRGSQSGMDLEDYSEFYTWTLSHTILDPEHVVRSLGVTRSGSVLMELAEGNLMQWYAAQPRTSGKGSDVATKVQVLFQAAKALHAVHRLGVIYGDLKSSKFLVFTMEGSDVVLKIAQLKPSANPWEQDAGPSWTGRWTGNELYEGSLPSRASDVFSFGVIMYEVMMQELPYGREATEAQIMDRKLRGVEPCIVPEALSQKWPKGLLELMKACCSSDPGQRPTTVEVCSRLEALSTKQELDGHLTKSELYFRYNRKCMEFLQEQLAKVNSDALPVHFTRTLNFEGTSEDEERAASYNNTFKRAMRLGRTLIRRHAKAFDMQKFYSATEAREGVQSICKDLKACMEWWKVQGVEIMDRVPQTAVEEDAKMLDMCLGYILDTDDESIFDGMPSNVQEEWEKAKREHTERLRHLRIVADEEIGAPQHNFSGSVYVAKYRRREHAVKSGKGMDRVGFARFYTEAAVLESARSPSVVCLYAVTRSGKLVMEKGEMDIMQWFLKHKREGLKFKLGLLRDAAQSLCDVHDAELVHRDIRTQKFVVFGEGQPEVKLVGFGKANPSGNITERNTVRKHGDSRFAAPEIFDGKACDMKSDIYSFGIVMYEMIWETLPYGRNATEAKVMSMKTSGEPPFDTPPGSCPAELLNLMEECCAVDPAARPLTMEKVHQQLVVLANLDDPQVASLPTMCELVDEVGEMLPGVTYSMKTLTFLHACMTMAKGIRRFPNSPDTLQAWNELVKSIKAGRKLILCHTQEFELSDYYTVEETVFLVNDCCTCILMSVEQLESGSTTHAKRAVPDCLVNADKAFLERHLGFVIGVLGRDCIEDDGLLDEWAAIKLKLDKKVNELERIRQTDIDWDAKAEIAHGAEGTVYSTRWKGRNVALKVLKDPQKSDGQHEQLARFWAETAINAEVKHPHVVRVLAMGRGANSGGVHSKPFLVMELATENLGTWYKKQLLEAWPLKRRVLFQAAKGLCYLHDNGVVHRDIKPQNILVFPDGEDGYPVIKLCDLGLATGQSAEWRRKSTDRKQPGTTLYQAPELFCGKRSNHQSDVFSFGMVMLEILANREPYVYNGLAGLNAKLQGKMPCPIPEACPNDLRVLIQRCLSYSPDERPAMQDVKQVLEV